MANTKFVKGMVPWNKGKTMSDEYRKIISESHKGLPSSRKGVKLSDVQKAKISVANKGRKHKPEAKIAISVALRNRIVSKETCEKLSKMTHKVGWKHTDESKKLIGIASVKYYLDESIRNRRRIQQLQRIKLIAPNGFEKYVGNKLAEYGLEFEFQFIADNKFAFDYRLIGAPILIECDCNYWHKNRSDQDRKKSIWAKDNGFKLVRIDYESAVFNKLYVDGVLKNEVVEVSA